MQCRLCLTLADHPSLRFGPATHFMRLWRGSALNAVVLIDPDFGLDEVSATYPLRIWVPYPTRNGAFLISTHF